MNYLFISGSMKDKGGLAMMQGAINGIKFLDPHAQFAAVVAKEEEAEHPDCPVVTMKDGIRFADRFLDVGGRCHDSLDRRRWVGRARRKDIPLIWMSQSFAPMLQNRELFIGTIPIARGSSSAKKVENITGRSPVVAADLSFLVIPKGWGERVKYERAFTTHIKKTGQRWNDHIIEDSIQIVWKEDKNRLHEPMLPMKQYSGTVEENFGMIANCGALYTSRYQAACAAILAGKPLMLMTAEVNAFKYHDLKAFRRMSKEQLRASAMLSCVAAVEAGKMNPWSI